MINIFKFLLDFIYETKCYFCSDTKEDTVFCSKCYHSVVFFDNTPIIKIFNCNVYAVTYYKEITQKLIRAIKYHNKTELVPYQAKLMYEYWQKTACFNKNYTVVPVPMFYSKARKRKFNHMDLIGEEFCNLTGYQFNKTNLYRTRETAPQYNLSKNQRIKNLKGAFSLRDNCIQEPILLIDDISTTGTTLSEIIKVFNENNIYDITCLVTAIPENNKIK